jgi:hypothetical protein
VLESTDFSLSGDILTLHGAGRQRQIPLRSPTRGWIRRLAPPYWRRSVLSGSREAAIRGAWTNLVAAVAGAPEVAWLTPLERLFLRENKLLQARAAKALGIAIPRTAVVSQRVLLPVDLGDSLVVKPLGASTFTDSEGTERVVWARELGRDSPALDSMEGAPFLVQPFLKADRHLRAVTVNEEVWLCELDAQDMPTDWRRDERAHESFVTASEPSVERDAIRLATSLGVGYSSQDWIVAEGVSYFLDLNPAGQWLFLPDEVGSAVTNSIASWLIG